MQRKLVFFALFLPLFISAQNTVMRTLSAFNRVSVSGGFHELVLKEGDSESAKLVVSGIDPDKIITEVSNGVLKIGMKNGSYGNYKARLVITYRRLEGISNSGSTDIVAESVIKTDKFEYSSSGSGNFSGAFDVAKLKIAISGRSDMQLKGLADEQDISISGSGDVDAAKLRGKTASVAISGSGDVDLNVSGRVNTRISGSGDVTNN